MYRSNVKIHDDWRSVPGVIHEPRSVTSDVQARLHGPMYMFLSAKILTGVGFK